MKRAMIIILILCLTALGVQLQVDSAQSALDEQATAPIGACNYQIYLPMIVNNAAGKAADSVLRGDIAPPVSPNREFADFNGDGCADLAVGIPNQTVNDLENAGAFIVYYGSRAHGISAAEGVRYNRANFLISGEDQADAQFGYALAVGDFNADGYSDLAVSAPFDTVAVPQAGSVSVFYGSSDGLSVLDDQFWSQATTGISYANEAGDTFGFALAAGNFDDDAFDDLAIGIPGENEGNISDSGAVYVLNGSANGITATGSRGWTQNSSGMQGSAETSDQFGFALAAADFDGSDTDDLAIGAPFEDSIEAQQGNVAIIYSDKDGLTATGNQLWSRPTLVNLPAQQNEGFGRVLAAGRIDRNPYADLVIGSPNADQGASNSGAAYVAYGTSNGLSATASQYWHLGTTGVDGETQANARFGAAVTIGNYNGSPLGDVAIGAPEYDPDNPSFPNLNVNNGGAVLLLQTSNNGLVVSGNQLLTKALPQTNDHYGAALFSADFNADSRRDLVIGIPNHDQFVPNVIIDGGAVQVFLSSDDGFGPLNIIIEDDTKQLGFTLP